MARNAKAVKTDDAAITRGAGRAFTAPGYTDVEERQTKVRLAVAVNDVIDRRRLTQARLN